MGRKESIKKERKEVMKLQMAIYLMYCCSKDGKREPIKICKENEKIYGELKNIIDENDIFEKKNVQDFSYCNIGPIKEDRWHVRLIKK